MAYPKGSLVPSSWGFSSESTIERDRVDKDYAEWFKILLDPRKLQERQKNNPKSAPKSQEEVDRWYGDYLRLLYQHIESKLSVELPNEKPWTAAKVEFHFSLPTTWQPYPTVEKFRNIVEAAGYGSHQNHTVEMGLTEPEAAAVHTSIDARGLFNENENMIICDAGGGTTDLSVMRISGVQSGLVTLKQLDTVNGKNIGSVQIDREFEEYVLNRLQQVNNSFNLGIDPDESAWQMMKSREFQNAKCDFGSTDDTPSFLVAVPGLDPKFVSKQFGMQNGNMEFKTGALLGRMFDLQIDKMTKLVDKHLIEFEKNHPGEQVSHFVFSGGLGNSQYVQSSLKAKYAFGQSQLACAQNIQIHVAPNPQLAVCMGVVADRVARLKGTPVVKWKCARASYGTVAKILHDPKDPEHHGRKHVQGPAERKVLHQ